MFLQRPFFLPLIFLIPCLLSNIYLNSPIITVQSHGSCGEQQGMKAGCERQILSAVMRSQRHSVYTSSTHRSHYRRVTNWGVGVLLMIVVRTSYTLLCDTVVALACLQPPSVVQDHCWCGGMLFEYVVNRQHMEKILLFHNRCQLDFVPSHTTHTHTHTLIQFLSH